MKNYLLLVIFCLPLGLFGQDAPVSYNTASKVNIGFSSEHLDHFILSNSINDTSSIQMNFNGWSPSISYTQDFVFGDVISVSANLGFQYMNLSYGTASYGGSNLYTSIAPSVTLVNRLKWEYYIKLKLGGVFYWNDRQVIPEPSTRFFPERANFFTGVTLAGFNFFLNDKWGINLEASVWSPELLSIGGLYRFHSKSLKLLKGK